MSDPTIPALNAWSDFTTQQIRSIRDELRRLRKRIDALGMGQGSPISQPQPDPAGSTFKVMLTTSTITARSGTTPGSGTATIQSFNGSVLSSTGTSVTVYSILAGTPSVIASGSYIECNLDGSTWWVTGVDKCSNVS